MPDDLASVRDHIIFDVIIPKAKNVASETLDILLYGSSNGGYSRRSNGMQPSYRSYYDDKRSKNRPKEDASPHAFSYEEVEFDDYGDACEVLRLITEEKERYGTCTVAALYEYSRLKKEIRNVHFKYGWMDVSRASVVPFRGKYILRMPKVMPLD